MDGNVPENAFRFLGPPVVSAVCALPLPPITPVENGKRRPAMAAVGFSRARSEYPLGDQRVSSLQEMLARPLEAVLLLNIELWEAFRSSAETLFRLAADESAVVILVARRPAPVSQFRPDGPVFSFICRPAVLKQVLMHRPNPDASELCFEVLHQILNGSLHEVGPLLVRQIPEEHPSHNLSVQKLPVGLIMAHRGEHCYLDTALRYLEKAEGNSRRARVGLDVESLQDYQSLIQSHPSTEFFRVQPTPAGPYVIRQELAKKTTEPLFVLQDSDDLSCYDRFARLAAEIADTGCRMVGSHELRVDEIERWVAAVRFPLDATAALSQQNCFALLHASLMITREAFFLAGGLSTDQIVANDTQFLLRAYFYFRIRNVDEFLYVRRRHRRALTIAPETAAGNDLRTRLDNQWTLDFEAVKRGEITLQQSSLRPMRGKAEYQIERITADLARGHSNCCG